MNVNPTFMEENVKFKVGDLAKLDVDLTLIIFNPGQEDNYSKGPRAKNGEIITIIDIIKVMKNNEYVFLYNGRKYITCYNADRFFLRVKK
jgi:hypothetical protein